MDVDTSSTVASTAAVAPGAPPHASSSPVDRISTVDYRLQDDSSTQDDTPSTNNNKAGCCPRLLNELKPTGPGFFGIREPNGSNIDVEATFAPPPMKRTLMIRVLFFTATLVTIARTYFVSYEAENTYQFISQLSVSHNAVQYTIYIALSSTALVGIPNVMFCCLPHALSSLIQHWALLFCALYQIVASICTAFRSTLIQPEADEPQTPRFFTRIMWGLYSLAAPSVLIVTILYWSVVYDKGRVDVSMENLMAHGGVLLMVLFDGLIIAHIPVRMKQILYLYIVSVAFIAWTVIDDLVVTGNDAEKDAIDNVFSWKTKPLWAGLWTAVTLLAIVPAAYYIIWLASLWSRWCKFDGGRRRVYGGTAGGSNGVMDQRRYRKGLV